MEFDNLVLATLKTVLCIDQLFQHERDMMPIKFLNRVKQAWFQRFPFLRLKDNPKLKNLVCPEIE